MAQRQVVSAGLVYLAASSVSAGCWVGVLWRVAAEIPRRSKSAKVVLASGLFRL